MGSPIDKERLLQGLSQDFDQTNEAVKQSALGRGTISAPENELSFLPKAIRYKGKIIGEKELGDLHSLIDKATDEIVNTSTKYTNEEKAQVKHELNQKMHEYSMDVLQKTLAFGNHLKSQGYDLEQELASQNAWMQMLSGATAGIVGYGGKSGGNKLAPNSTQPTATGTTGNLSRTASYMPADPYSEV